MKKDNNQKLSVLWSLLCLFFFVILFNSCYNNEDDPVYENLKELVVSNTAVNLEYGDSTTVTISQGMVDMRLLLKTIPSQKSLLFQIRSR